MVRSPAGIEIGDGGAPFIKRLSWQQWRATYANGTGKLHVQHNPSCQPSYLCRYDVCHVKVHLHRVITDRGTAVFSRMRWTYGRAAHVLYLRVTSRILDLLTQTLLPRLLTNVWICHRRSHQSRRCPAARRLSMPDTALRVVGVHRLWQLAATAVAGPGRMIERGRPALLPRRSGKGMKIHIDPGAETACVHPFAPERMYHKGARAL